MEEGTDGDTDEEAYREEEAHEGLPERDLPKKEGQAPLMSWAMRENEDPGGRGR